jgi:endonuclease/exonuclease/phosphatase family metal-dependent hydrolase
MKLITWNIQWGLGMDGEVDLARMVAHAKSMGDFDVLCLQEVSDNFSNLKANRGNNQFAEIAGLLPGYTAVNGVALDIPDGAGGRRRFGNMILSRLPVGIVLRYILPWEAAKTRNMPRILLDVVVEAPFGPLRVMTSHLEYSSDKLRQAQVEGIREAHRTACERVATPRENGPGTYVRGANSASAILTGDFNMRPDDKTKQRISQPIPGAPALLDAWEVLHPGQKHPDSFCIYEQTFSGAHCCDFVFVTEDLAPRLRRVHYDTKTKVSDHQPVLIELE